jgi:hypothetical protein
MTCPWVAEIPEHVAPFESRSGIAFLGGFRHPPNFEAMRYFAEQVMPELRKRAPEIVLTIYGSHIDDKIRALAGPNIRIHGYVETVAEVYQTARVFIAPLISGAGIKGKVISALAHGLPCILSPVAAEGMGLRDGEEALIAIRPPDWVEAVTSLYNDQIRWTRMSDAARILAHFQYGLEKSSVQMRMAMEAIGLESGNACVPVLPFTPPPSSYTTPLQNARFQQ